METIFVLIVCLAITGQINGQEIEDVDSGLQSAMAKIVSKNHKENSEEIENQPLNSEADDDGAAQKGKIGNFFEREKPAGDPTADSKLAAKVMVESKNNKEKKESGKQKAHIKPKLKGSNETSKKKEDSENGKSEKKEDSENGKSEKKEDSENGKSKKKEDSENGKSKKKEDSENGKSEKRGHKRGQYKQLAFKKPVNQAMNKNQRIAGAKLNENPKRKKFITPNRNQKGSPSGRKMNKHPPMNSQSRGPAHKNNKKSMNLPNGGKVVYAQLPDSLLMKQVPKLSTQKAHPLKPKRKPQNANKQPALRNQNRKKPVKNNNNNNQMNVKKAWKELKG